MKNYISSLLRHVTTALASLGVFLLSVGWIVEGDVTQVNAAGVTLGAAAVVIFTAIISRVLLTLTGKMFTGGAGEASAASGGARSLLLLGTVSALAGWGLTSCSSGAGAAAWNVLKTLPIHTTVVTDYGAASYSSKSGITVEVDAQSGK